ncbi:hypothetical protein M514_11003 [Trichuris suis]|uniref:Uncharacterized protein n=1 Tax=Trichuris suis TaxID=68888 RepID=A0A085MX65_9BILA|nr:hypothetical protein M513_11003 [Trichuris suis]KFD61811.1 hypothetical protein M514_11003 [Trichuris suis]
MAKPIACQRFLTFSKAGYLFKFSYVDTEISLIMTRCTYTYAFLNMTRILEVTLTVYYDVLPLIDAAANSESQKPEPIQNFEFSGFRHPSAVRTVRGFGSLVNSTHSAFFIKSVFSPF